MPSFVLEISFKVKSEVCCACHKVENDADLETVSKLSRSRKQQRIEIARLTAIYKGLA